MGDASAESALPGLTAVDAAAIARAKAAAKRPRSRLLSWISGDYDEGTSPAEAGALSLPDLEVRREMLRLQVQADLANLQAEADAILAEAAAEGRPIKIPGVAAIETIVGAVDTADPDDAAAAHPDPDGPAEGQQPT